MKTLIRRSRRRLGDHVRCAIRRAPLASTIVLVGRVVAFDASDDDT
jgi:hypothetical protein